jgi:ubiquinone/menaquinone biosynthesis C-methylase UbiE
MIDVLDEIVFPLKELKEVYRIMKKNGVLVIRVRNAYFHFYLNSLINRFLNKIVKNPTVLHIYSFTPKTLQLLLKKVGFKNLIIKNSLLTTGDPYNQMKLNLSKFYKPIFYSISQIIYFFTFKKIFISPSLLVFARK